MTAAIVWTVLPSLKSWVAATIFEQQTISASAWETHTDFHELKRSIQRHFLNYDVYVPLEDMIQGLPPQGSAAKASELSLLMQKACGQATLYVWIPIRFRIPLIGDRVTEWCWKPPIQIQ